jgi:hypothetical protein
MFYLYQAREIGRNLRHSPTLEVEDIDLHQYFIVFQQLLSDAGNLATDIHAQDAKQKLINVICTLFWLTIQAVV